MKEVKQCTKCKAKCHACGYSFKDSGGIGTTYIEKGVKHNKCPGCSGMPFTHRSIQRIGVRQ